MLRPLSTNQTLSPCQSCVYHPLTILAVSALATGMFVALMLPLRRFAGRRRFFLFAYHAPIGFAFVTYLFDRAKRLKRLHRRQRLIELPVLGLGFARALAPVPFISGHALFLSYLLVTTPLSLAWWVAALVLVDVVCVKLMLGDATLLGGTGLGLLAGLLVRLRSQPDPIFALKPDFLDNGTEAITAVAR